MAAVAADSSSTAGYGRGIAMQVIAVAMFASMGMVIKLLDGRYPTSQIILFRCAPALIPLILYLPLQGGWTALKTRRPMWHAVRSVAGILSMYVGFYALGRMAFADYVAISFTAPLFGTLLSIPFLGERVGIWRLGAVGLGFAGALLTAGPIGSLFGVGEFDPMVLFAVGSAFGYGIAMIAMRKLGSTDKSSATVFYFTVAGALSSLFLLPAQWVTPTPQDLALLMTIGLVGGVAQIFMTEAFRLAPPSVIAPFDYTAMLWALAFGFFVFGTFPGPQVLAGATLICVSGLFIIHREAVRGVKRAKLKSSSL